MRVHGTHLNPIAANLYAAVEAKKAAAKQAAEVRKKLLSSASQIEGEAAIQPVSTPDEEKEKDSDQGPENPQTQKKNDLPGNAGEDDQSGDPISLWG